MFDKLPNEQELSDFKAILGEYRSLPTSFVRDIIMKAPSTDMMNTLARSVLTLYSYDYRADDTSLPNVLRQCLQLISLFPEFAIYGYQAFNHYHEGESLYIHPPVPELSTAENILHLLRPDSKYTPLEAKLLDIALVVTTRPLPLMLLLLRLRIPTLPLPQPSGPLRVPVTVVPISRLSRCSTT